MKILITGGAGFIGSALIRYLIAHTEHHVICVDALTYAANPEALHDVANHPRYQFIHANVCDAGAMRQIFQTHQPEAVMHLAAESHVDNSIRSPDAFIHSNIVGTYTLLEVARQYVEQLSPAKAKQFRFHHVSTDEVYGDVGLSSTQRYHEEAAYRPSSPYAASKASADHLVRAWHRTYGLPIVISASSNNYGPYQYPEKLIPVIVAKALAHQAIPLYGDGLHTRDWLHVDDHARALLRVLLHGKTGESYNISAANWRSNRDVMAHICQILDSLQPLESGQSYSTLIQHVADRPGHDHKYAVDATKITTTLGWTPQVDFEDGLQQTVTHYWARFKS